MSKDVQKPANPDIEQNAFEALDETDRLYVEMKVQGYPMTHIAKKAKRAHRTVREWFAKGGRLYDAYKLREKEHRQEYKKSFASIDKLIKEGAVDAVLKLLEAVRASGVWPTHIMAANSLLDRAGFKPSDQINATVTQKTDGAIVEKITKIDEQLTALIAGRAGDSTPTD